MHHNHNGCTLHKLKQAGLCLGKRKRKKGNPNLPWFLLTFLDFTPLGYRSQQGTQGALSAG